MTLQTKLPGSAIQTGTISVTAITNFSGELSASLPPDVVSSSAQVKTFLPTNTVSSSAQVTAFLPTGTVSSSAQLPSGIASSSAQVIAYLPTDSVSSSAQVTAFLPTGTVSSSTQLPSGIASSSAQVIAFLPTGTVSSSTQVDVFTTIGGNTLATTGSNTFTAAQTISDTTNSTSYLDGALHVEGGMSVRKDVRVSGSMTINGLLTAVSMSTQYVTSSQYNIGVSRITLNDDDNVRFAGISIIDSGSASPTSASIFWDSLQHRFIYENLSGSAYNSSIIIAGPKHTGSLGDEPTLTSGYVPYATGNDHIDNSVIYQSGSNIGIGTTNPQGTLHSYGIIPILSDRGTVSGGFVYQDFYANGSLRNRIRSDTSNYRLDLQNASESNLLTILQDGKVGIGITNPTQKLVISDSSTNGTSVNIVNTSTGGYNWNIFSGGSAETLGPVGSLIFRDSNNGVTRMLISSSGNVGIGTTSPVAKLDVRGSIASSYSAATYATFDSSTDGNLYITANAGAANVSVNTIFRSSTAGGAVTERMRIDSSGNVGIGTTNPGTVTEIFRSSSDRNAITRLLTLNNASGNNPFDGFGTGILFKGNDYSNAVQNFAAIDAVMELTGLPSPQPDTAFGAGLRLYTGTNGALTERVRINASGSVGIGTTNPTAKLEVSGSSGLPVFISSPQNASLTIKRQTTSNKWTFTHDSNGGNVGIGANGLGIISDDANGDFGIRTTSTGNVQFYIATSGNIGIGNTSPEVKLHIFDSTARTGVDNVAFPLHIENTAAGGAYAVYTGIRFKSNYNSSPNYNFILQETTSTGGGKLHLGSYVSSAYTNQVTLVGSSGNVGIGTTNPTATLQVVGPNTTGTFIAAQNDGAGGFLGVRVNTSSSPYNHFSFSNGYVGIGTTSPSTTLVVVGGAAAISTSTVSYTIAVQDPTSAAINVGGSILFQGYKTGTASIGNYAYITGKKENGTSGNEAGYLALGTFDSVGNKAEYFRITSAGNVGIGTTNPFALLHVKGTDSLTANTRYFKGWIGGAGSWGANSYEELGVGFSGIRSIYISGDNWDLAFSTGTSTTFNAGTQAERMRIKANGNVGIGTTNPDDKFQVNGGNLRVSANTTSGTFLDIVPSGTQADGIALSTSFYGGGSYGPLRINTGGSETMRITAGNRVGIGETNPGVKLHVEGVEYNRGNIVRPTVFAGDSSSAGSVQGTYVLGNGKFFNTGGGARYVHILLPARYNQDNSRMFCVEIKGYDFDRPGIINVMVGGYVTPPNNGGPMSRVATWDATSYYSPTAYYSTNYAVGVVRIYFPSIYYASFVVNSIASGNGDTIAPDEMTMILSTSATI